ncbi:MAG: nitronate monooxygenase [Chloroflexota bacterium]|nr:nitronate monooxygenase [Chloroflexota bacterium]
MWPDHRIQDLFGIELPIIQAPMAGAVGEAMAIAVSEAGGLGSLPCAMLSPDEVVTALGQVRERTTRPINLNFFCHQPPRHNPERERAWQQRLTPYYLELGIDLDLSVATPSRASFDAALCDAVVELAPTIVSFHFGLPDKQLLDRIKTTGAKLMSSATTVEEARWLEQAGCDAIIAQGAEAGGHRGMFLTSNVSTQIGTMALVPQVVDTVSVPVIAAGGIADARGIVAAFALGASAVQMGTAYLRCPETLISPLHRQALAQARDDQTVLTNVFTGRPARALVNRFVREVGPISNLAPDFPGAAAAVTPLRLAAEPAGADDFSFMLSGQAAPLGLDLPAAELTRQLATASLARFA